MVFPLTAALMGGGSLLSGLGGFMGAQNVAQGNQQAAGISGLMQTMALQQAQQNFQQAQQNLQPFMNTGSKALDLLMGYLQGGANGIGGGGNSLISTFAPTMAQLESTPGYQFIKDQGLKSVQNSAAAKGLGSSGNALQGGVQFAEGLAGTTFQQQLENYLKQNQQAYNMLFAPGQLGAGAAQANMAGTGQFNNALLSGAQGIGNTLAGGVMGAANAQGNAMNSVFGGMGNALTMGGLGLSGYFNRPVTAPNPALQ